MELYCRLNDRPPFRQGLMLAFQHLVASLSGIIAVPLLLGGALGLEAMETAHLVNAALLISGVATIVQCLGFGPMGVRLPIVMGTSFAVASVSVTIGLKEGLPAVLGAAFVGGILVMLLSGVMHKIRRLFPPVVTGTVVCLIGLTLVPVGVDWFAGGKGAENYGAPINLSIGLLVLVVAVVLNQCFKGFVSAAALIISMLTGCILCIALGIVDFSPIAHADTLNIPAFLEYGMTFSVGSLLAMMLAYMVIVMEAIGDYLAVANFSETRLEPKPLAGGILWEGAASSLGSLFGCLPVASFSQNVGIINVTGVASRFVVAGTGAILLCAGLFPKLGAVIASIPLPVIGGAGIVMFSMIIAGGIRILAKVEFDRRNSMVMALGIGVGLAVSFRPEIISALPEGLQTILHNGIATGSLTAMLLNLVLPGGEVAEEKSAAVLVED